MRILIILFFLLLFSPSFSQRINYVYSSDTSVIFTKSPTSDEILKFMAKEKIFILFTGKGEVTITKGVRNNKIKLGKILSNEIKDGIKMIKYTSPYSEIWLTFSGEILLNLGLFKEESLLIYTLK